jgi:Putative collagen-binding domain of a collagenase
MSKFPAPVAGHWYDPTNGRYSEVSGSTLKNAGARQFTPPGKNSAGDGDWVLVLGD